MKTIHTKKAPPAAGPYSQAVIANGFLFCSGQVGRDPQTGTIGETVEEQTHQVIKNLKAVIEEAGCSLNDVVKTTIYLTDVNDFATVNEIYAQYFTAHKPARATVGVANLPKGNLATNPLIEIDAVALVK
jgi:2-iminobutanoate/2-iminopropanoate deaminase